MLRRLRLALNAKRAEARPSARLLTHPHCNIITLLTVSGVERVAQGMRFGNNHYPPCRLSPPPGRNPREAGMSVDKGRGTLLTAYLSLRDIFSQGRTREWSALFHQAAKKISCLPEFRALGRLVRRDEARGVQAWSHRAGSRLDEGWIALDHLPGGRRPVAPKGDVDAAIANPQTL
jgi:hypothetical protein